MSPERWRRVDEIFQAAIELKPEERSAFVVSACGGDEALRREVDSLVTADEQGLSLVDEPAFQVAAGLLGTGEPELAEGQTIGHFEIIELIGRGGMGEVYLAKDKLLNRGVALKLLPAAYTSNKDRLRRFQQEAQAASALNHPNILTIYELGQVNRQQFIATEFIEGETLRLRLRRAPPNLAETLDLAIQIGSALATAHNAGIVHRDIKPENLMLRRDGYIKVLDFGLAKLTEQHEPPTRARAAENLNTSSGLVMGTVKYMSPEQARGHQVDSRSDIFSFGVVLYEMLAGRTPFEGDTSRELIAAILKKEPPPLTGVPDEMRRLINRALRKRREERYQTIQEMLVDLKSVKEDKLVSGRGVQIASATTAGSRLSSSEAAAISARSTVEYVVSGIRRHKTTAAFIFASLAIAGVSLPSSLNRLGSKLRVPAKEMTTTVTVPGNAGPWLVSLNPDFPYTWENDYAAPAIVDSTSGIPFVAGSNITVTYVSGTFTGDGGGTYLDANGSTFLTDTNDSSNARFPGFYLNSGPIDYGGKLIGAFGNNGVMVGTPFPIGNGPTMLTIPAGATELMMGINDDYYSDNSGALLIRVTTAQTVTIPSTAGPWSPDLNPTFDYGVHDNTPPVVIDGSSGIAFTPGSTLIVIYLGGTVQAGVGYSFNDANGHQSYVTNSCSRNCFPAFHMNPGANVYSMALVGTFADNGVIVGAPFPIGNCPTAITIPSGANQLLLGINDNRYSDNSGSFTVAISSGSTTPKRVARPSHAPNKASGC